MTTTTDWVAKFSEQELLDYFTDLVARDRRTTADLLVAIAEIDERKLWAMQACSSMFTFCMERFHMSEQVTAKRLWAARTARRFPVILEMVARGELHLGAIHLLARHLTDENHETVLESAKHKSTREIERMAAGLAPRSDVPSRIRALPRPRENRMEQVTAAASMDGISGDAGSSDPSSGDAVSDGRSSGSRGSCVQGSTNGASSKETSRVATTAIRNSIVPLSPRRYKIEITVDEATHDKLRSLQDLLGRSATGRDPAEIISRAIDVLLVRTLARKAACTDRPRPATTNASAGGHRTRSRVISAAVRREVWQRDSGRCCYTDAFGRRCRETSSMEFHHKVPFAVGGPSTADNIELRCTAHNQFQADLDFGRSFMDARRGCH